MTLHSAFGGSSAHRWLACPGSIRLIEKWHQEHPDADESSPWAQEGTAGHTIAAACLDEDRDAIEYAGKTIDGVEIDDSIVEAVQVYLDTIRADQQPGSMLLVEVGFELTDLHHLFYGTADCVIINRDGGLTVYDLKLGRGQIVEVLSGNGPNPQLGYYALGALHANVIGPKIRREIKKVELVVVQPRAWHRQGPVRRATFDVSEIEALGKILVEAAAECEKPDAALIPGEHCRFCVGMPGCPAIRHHAYEAAQVDFGDGKPADPKVMDLELLSRTLSDIDLIEQWIAAVRAHAHKVAEGPDGLPGWKLIDKQARRKWVNENIVAATLEVVWGLEMEAIYETTLKSPAQVEKLLPPSERKSPAFKALCPAVSSGTTLVRADHPHQEAAKPPDVEYFSW